MMLKSFKALALSLVLITSVNVKAQDLESLLDEGSKPVKKQDAKKPGKKMIGLSGTIKNILGTPTSEQNVFLRQVEAGEWDKATLQFPKAFEGTGFQKSANGRAVFGLVQFKAGLPVTGMETLFSSGAPNDINAEIRSEWKTLVTPEHFVWNLAKISWNSGWDNVFSKGVGYKIKTRAMTSISNMSELKALAELAPEGSRERADIEWQLVLAYSLNDQADKAAKLLATLMRSEYLPVSKDLMQLTAARLLFQNGYFDASIKYYEKVSKESEFWTEAQEEIAWAYVRKGEPQNAIAVSRGLVNAAMNNQVSAEAYFVSSLSQLKVCDYTAVSKNLEAFPKAFKNRTKVLGEISKGSDSQDVTKAIDLLKVKKIRVQDLGQSAETLPRLITRDEKLFDFAQSQKHFEDEAKTAETLYAKSLAQTGLQGYFANLKQTTLSRAQMAKTAAYTRVKELAKTEVEETKEILRKLHIVEAEVIQQVALSDQLTKNSKAAVTEKKGTTGAKGQDTLTFAADDEIWFDEISNYKVDVKKACHAKR